MNENEAYVYLINYLKNPKDDPKYQKYDCDLYLVNIVSTYIEKKEPGLGQITGDHPKVQNEMPAFHDVAAYLCRQGILRAGVRTLSPNNPVNGLGFSLTRQGKEWLKSPERNFIDYAPSHFSELFKKFTKFGEGFEQRVQEACKTYLSGCYLATCVMCGAAAEAILLNLALQKEPSKADSIRKAYEANGGTGRIFKSVTGHLNYYLREELSRLNELIKYRRDVSGRGQYIEISEFHAYDSLSRLVRLSHLIIDKWDEIINS